MGVTKKKLKLIFCFSGEMNSTKQTNKPFRMEFVAIVLAWACDVASFGLITIMSLGCVAVVAAGF